MPSFQQHKLSYSVLIICGLIGVGFFYHHFNPVQYAWMPQCPTKALFNLDCPGCGLQRALYALLHGRVRDAFSLNPFLFFALPYAIALFASLYITDLKLQNKVRNVLENNWMIYGYVVVYFIWFVVRNIIK